MSSDNGYIVTALSTDRNRFGIFHYCASVDQPPMYYVEKNAIEVFNSPTNAILRAHKIDRDSWTEYGVRVNSLALSAAILERRG